MVYKIVALLCLVGSLHANDTCEEITAPMCKNIGYTLTKFPNSFGHEKQDDAGHEIHKFSPLVQTGCSPYLQQFLCELYIPQCDPSKPNIPITLPSRQLCEKAKQGCDSTASDLGTSWPEGLKCDKFDNDPTLDEDEDDEQLSSTFQLSIKYSSNAITFESCCHVYYYSQKTFFLPSDENVMVKTADVKSSNEPKVTWKRESGSRRKGDHSTLIMVTGYTESSNKQDNQPHIYTNWMVANIANGQVSSGITVKEYEGPQPTPNTDNKVYFLLYHHSKPLEISSLGKYSNPENSRYQLDIDAILKDNNMDLTASKYMLMEVDEYSRFKSIQDSHRPESEVCKGVIGYPKLCGKTLRKNVQLTINRKR
ncbi:uncharacterized protein [Mytilus edulis]|uniref:uncharacterized protein n=1 Tax=Mytilus edulis TaxID=6550 RepID=UPI0039F0C770